MQVFAMRWVLVGAFCAVIHSWSLAQPWQVVVLSDPEPTEEPSIFGTDVAMEGDFAFVSEQHSTASSSDSGVVHVFRRGAEGLNTWGFVQNLTSPDGDGLGFGIRLVALGEWLVVARAFHMMDYFGVLVCRRPTLFFYQSNDDGLWVLMNSHGGELVDISQCGSNDLMLLEGDEANLLFTQLETDGSSVLGWVLQGDTWQPQCNFDMPFYAFCGDSMLLRTTAPGEWLLYSSPNSGCATLDTLYGMDCEVDCFGGRAAFGDGFVGIRDLTVPGFPTLCTITPPDGVNWFYCSEFLFKNDRLLVLSCVDGNCAMYAYRSGDSWNSAQYIGAIPITGDGERRAVISRNHEYIVSSGGSVSIYSESSQANDISEMEEARCFRLRRDDACIRYEQLRQFGMLPEARAYDALGRHASLRVVTQGDDSGIIDLAALGSGIFIVEIVLGECSSTVKVAR